MPPIGRKLPRVEREITPQEKSEAEELYRSSQELYQYMFSLVTSKKTSRKTGLFGRRRSTPAVEYTLPGEPVFRKQSAWVEAKGSEAVLKTQVIERINGKIIRTEPVRERVNAEDGNLYIENVSNRSDLDFLTSKGIMSDIAATLELIEETAQGQNRT